VVNLVKIKIRGMYQPLGKGCGRPLHLTSSFFLMMLLMNQRWKKEVQKRNGSPYIFLVFFEGIVVLQHLCADYEQYLSNFKDTK
jgi:hypothetical protein